MGSYKYVDGNLTPFVINNNALTGFTFGKLIDGKLYMATGSNVHYDSGKITTYDPDTGTPLTSSMTITPNSYQEPKVISYSGDGTWNGTSEYIGVIGYHYTGFGSANGYLTMYNIDDPSNPTILNTFSDDGQIQIYSESDYKFHRIIFERDGILLIGFDRLHPVFRKYTYTGDIDPSFGEIKFSRYMDVWGSVDNGSSIILSGTFGNTEESFGGMLCRVVFSDK